MKSIGKDKIRKAVRERYAKVAAEQEGCCSPCCCSASSIGKAEASAKLGYSPEELQAVPEGSNMGLGCGNPQAIAALKQGEVVLDLGSGGGFDCFLAATKVGGTGLVIGVDMTPEMIAKARENACSGGFENVEFRLGEIEHLPVADASVDVLISNCVINLSPDKPQVYRETWRVLRSGGRVVVSDVVALGEIPESLREDFVAYSGCVAGAVTAVEVEEMLRAAGFEDIHIEINEASREFIKDWFPGTGVEEYVVSACIKAKKH